MTSALNTIRVDDLRRHVDVLAADTYEGREAGSRGGRAAGVYIGRELQRLRLSGGAGNSYYQSFGPNHRNILARMEGSDPQLATDVIIVSAHYDHVGYGNRDNSFGPIGYIHNGADDNASGTSALIEVIEALVQTGARPRRTLLFAFWDAEEKGLLGSYYWLDHPTVPLEQVRVLVNMDMVGRLIDNRLMVYGTRAMPGMRARIAQLNHDGNLLLDFTWEMKDDSDHYPFFARNIPALMFHTGLHDDYHRPSDDVEKLNWQGMEGISRLLVRVIDDLANREPVPVFRDAAHQENADLQKQVERPLAPLPGRLGVLLQPEMPGVRLYSVAPGSSAAAAGLRPGDRVLRIGAETLESVEEFRRLIATSASPVEIAIERVGLDRPLVFNVNLAGQPVRLGISWRLDEAEPGCVILNRVVPSSPAAVAGLQEGDRVHEIDGQRFNTEEDFVRLAAPGPPLEFVIERAGQFQNIKIETSGTASETERAF